MSKESVVTPVETAQKIWEEIKQVPINMFSLPGQTVEAYATPAVAVGDVLYLQSVKVDMGQSGDALRRALPGAFLPALEDALQSKYVVEQMHKYVTVARKQ